MPNTLTDEYQLVTTSTLAVNFIQNLLHRVTISSKDGFSLELFRNDGFVRSIRTPTDTTAAHQGDTLLAVNLGIITVPLTDNVRTGDEGVYFIAYDATVRLMVHDAHQFALGYVQGIDPLQKTVDVILAALKGYIGQRQHDEVSAEELREVVKNDTGTVRPFETPSVGIGIGVEQMTLVEAFGVAILDAQTMSPRPDPKRLAEREAAKRVEQAKKTLGEDEEIRLATIKQQDTIQTEQHKLDKHKKNDEIELDHIQWVYELQKREGEEVSKLRSEFTRRQFEENWTLVVKLRRDGWSDATIAEHYPGLVPLIEPNNFLAGSHQPGSPAIQQPSPQVIEAAQQRIHIVSRSNGIWTIEHLGITVSPHELSEHEATLARASAQALSYRVEEILAPERHKGGTPLQPHDLIYEMDDKSVRELEGLQSYLDEWQQRRVVLKVTFLRGENSGAAQIEIPFA